MNIERNQDLVDASTDLELLYTIPKFPAFLGCVSTDPAQDIVADMNFYIGKNTGMVQLNPILPLDVVYQTDHNQGATGTTWLHHHSEFAKFIARHSPKQVFEIGGSHGLLSQLYLENTSADWYIIEPNQLSLQLQIFLVYHENKLNYVLQEYFESIYFLLA